MNILMLVIKNTARLDFALPLLWKVKQKLPQANVSVLYCIFSRKKVLRESRFYSDTLKRCGIPEYDFADFLPAPYGNLSGLWRRLCSQSNWDSSVLQRSLGQFAGGRTAARYTERLLNELEDFLTRKAVIKQILPSLSPDIILLDNTAMSRFPGWEHFYDYFSSTRRKVILLPHAPHHAYTTAFHPFDETGNALPDYCEFWMPFRFDQVWVKMPEKKSQFAYVGYPGMDSEWLQQLTAGGRLHPSRKPGLSRPLRCLFIIRKFVPKGQERGPGDDAFVYDYEEFSHYLSLVGTALRSTGVDIELMVKPHPSNDFQTLKDVFTETAIPRWRIAQDSVYALLPECDFVISLYSTVPLITAMAGIPTVILNSRIQAALSKEEVMKQLYTGLHFYLENPQDLPARLNEVIEIASKQRQSSEKLCKGDIEHLRYFYPDGAIQRCLERMGI